MNAKEAFEELQTKYFMETDESDKKRKEAISVLDAALDRLAELERRPTAEEVCEACAKGTCYPCKVAPNGEIWFRICEPTDGDDGWVLLVETYGDGTYAIGAYLKPSTHALLARFYAEEGK